MEVKGRIIAILDVKTGQGKNGTWKSQEFVIETTDSQYPKKICFEVFGEDKLTKYDIQKGCEYIVKFDIDAREYNGRWFNGVRAWSVYNPNGNKQQPSSNAQAAPSNMREEDVPF